MYYYDTVKDLFASVFYVSTAVKQACIINDYLFTNTRHADFF